MRFLYDFSLFLYFVGIKIASIFNPKAKKWIDGRKQIFEEIARNWDANHKSIWIHCASLGELEQVRPLIEQLKKTYPSHKILLTFYSPSGYDIRKNYPLADYVCYLPFDTKKNADKFINLIQPNLAIFVKYEFWYHHLITLKNRKIPTLLVSALFRPNQPFFKWYGQLHREMLSTFQHLFIQNQGAAQLLKKHAWNNYSIAGDTRIDRVIDIANKAATFPIIKTFVGDTPTLIAGSTWPVDEQLLIPFIQQQTDNNWKFIIAPHNIQDRYINDLEQKLGSLCIRYSLAKEKKIENQRVMIIDNIGMLSSIYQYGKIAYIGGGFGAGIHNTLEPIAFGLPVIFGPKYQKFTEALTLVQDGGAFVIQNEKTVQQVMDRLSRPNNYDDASSKAKAYISHNQGATKKILVYI